MMKLSAKVGCTLWVALSLLLLAPAQLSASSTVSPQTSPSSRLSSWLTVGVGTGVATLGIIAHLVQRQSNKHNLKNIDAVIGKHKDLIDTVVEDKLEQIDREELIGNAYEINGDRLSNSRPMLYRGKPFACRSHSLWFEYSKKLSNNPYIYPREQKVIVTVTSTMLPSVIEKSILDPARYSDSSDNDKLAKRENLADEIVLLHSNSTDRTEATIKSKKLYECVLDFENCQTNTKGKLVPTRQVMQQYYSDVEDLEKRSALAQSKSLIDRYKAFWWTPFWRR